MHIREFAGRNENICILGFGREGQAALRALKTYAPDGAIYLADANPDFTHPDYPVIAGPEYLEEIDRMHFWKIIKSPGIPPHPLFQQWKKALTSGTQIFLDTIADTGATVIGVSGSKGKSTTSTLIYEVLKAGGKEVHLIGNIGKPAIDSIDEAKPGVFFVEEMSSYQLMDLTVSPPIAVVTSFFPEHLDYHGSLENYLEAKKHLTRFQKKDDVVFFNAKSVGAKEIADESKGKKIPFSDDDSPVSPDGIHLIGAHNLSNIAAAYKVGLHLGIPKETCIGVFKNFRGLPHRLQSLGTHHGIEWVDDAISTTPESAIAALDALGDKVETIILGGQDRGNDFSQLGERICNSAIKTIILFPGSGARIEAAIQEVGGREIHFLHAASMPQAVSLARQHTSPGKICLLSTASPSYGMFKNFEEKGDIFKQCISEDEHPRTTFQHPKKDQN